MRRLLPVFVILAFLLSAAPSFAREKLVIYWSFVGADMMHPYVKKELEEFERKHDVELVFVRKGPLSTDDLHEAYMRLFSAKSSVPDILQLDVIRVPEFASMGYILDVTDYMTNQEKNGFFKSMVGEATWDGRIWAYPYYITAGLMVYRKDLVGKYPKSWAELVAAAQKHKRNGLYGYVGQMAEYEGFTCNLLEFLWLNGGDPDFDSRAKIFSQRDVAGLQIMVDLVNKYKLTSPDQLNYKELEGLQLLAEDKVLFLRHWPRVVFYLNREPSSGVEYGLMPLPLGPDGTKLRSTLGGWMLAINKNSRNIEASLELVKLLTSHRLQKHLIMNLSRMPAKKSVYADREVLARYPWAKEIYHVLKRAKNRPRSKYYPEISKILQEEFHLALEGKITAQQAIDRAERKIKAFHKSVEKAESADHRKRSRALDNNTGRDLKDRPTQ